MIIINKIFNSRMPMGLNLYKQWLSYDKQTYKLKSMAEENFQKKLRMTDNKSEIYQLFLKEIQSGQGRKQKIFSNTCRKFAAVFRIDHNKKITEQPITKVILIQDYKLLETIDLKKLTLSQLVDIVNYMNMITSVHYIDPRQKVVHQFANQLLANISAKWNEIQQDRIHSYLSKVARCAQYYENKLYSNFLYKIYRQTNNFTPYVYMTLQHILENSRNQSELTLIQLKIMTKILQNVLQTAWLQNNTKITAQMIFSIIEYHSFCSFIPQITVLLKKTKQKLVELLLQRYKSFSGEQLIRLCRIICKLDPKEQNCRRLYRSLYQQVRLNGETSISPSFYIYFEYYCDKIAKQLVEQQINQQKFMKLLIYYVFGDKKLYRDKYISKLWYMLQNARMKSQNKAILTQQLCTSFLKDMDTNKSRYIYMRMLGMAKFCVRNDRFDLLMLITKRANQQAMSQMTYDDYFYAMYNNMNAQLLSCIYPKYNKQFQKQQVNKIDLKNQNIMSLISYTLQYQYYLQKLEQSYKTIPKQAIITIIRQLLIQAIPIKFHSKVISLFQKFQQHHGICLKMLIQHILFPKLRIQYDSKIKAQLYLGILRIRYQKQRLNQVYESRSYCFRMFSNNLTVKILATYVKQQFLSLVIQLINRDNIQNKYYQYTIVRIFSQYAKNSINFSQFQRFFSQIGDLKFKNSKIFTFFYNIISQNQLPSLYIQQFNRIAERNRVSLSRQIKINLSNYQKILTQLIKCKKTQDNIEAIIELLNQYKKQIQTQINSKQLKENTLLRDFVRISRLLLQNLQNNDKIKENIKKILKQQISTLNLSNQTEIQWKYQALRIAYQLNLVMPQLFQNILYLTERNYQWCNKKADEIIKLLLEYPHETKWNKNFVIVLFNIVLENPYTSSVQLLAHKIEQFKQRLNFSDQFYALIKFIANKLQK